MRTRSAAALWLMCLLVLTSAACTSPEQPPRTAREKLDAAVGEQPSLPVVVPAELPGPYELDGVSGGQLDRAGVAFEGNFHYRQSEASRADGELPVVTVCVVRDGHPWACLPKREALSIHTVENVRAAVYSIGPGPDRLARRYWDGVKLTTRWQEVDWLQP